jgi:predicted GNAT family acetyltransferase
MNDVILKWDAPVTNPPSRGAFVLEEGNERVAEMAFKISGSDMTVYHTEVDKSLQGQGVSTKLFNLMVSYAREHSLKVIPLCKYVHTQFERRPDQFADIWKR